MDRLEVQTKPYFQGPKIAVVIPCFRVKNHLCEVIESIGPEVNRIYLIDDQCPEKSVNYALSKVRDWRIQPIFHQKNLGVGGATLTGFSEALKQGMDYVVKVDGDGQMDLSYLKEFILPLTTGECDFVKGNRFYNLEDLKEMPAVRILGNSILSFFSKISTGYWELSDPTNGYIAIRKDMLSLLPLEKISQDYFFESDLLFRLSTYRAKVREVSLRSHYGEEQSNLKVVRIIVPFMLGHARNLFKRIFYTYFLRSFSIASLELVFGLILITFGTLYGLHWWWLSYTTGVPASSGTVMVSALPFLMGFQLILSFLNFDMRNKS